MSHFTTWSTTLKDVPEKTIVDAITELAQQLEGSLINHISNRWDTNHSNESCLIGLRMAGLPNGIGVRIENGKLIIVGDSYNQEAAYDRLTQLIPNYIKIYQVKQKAKNNRAILGTKTKIGHKDVELRVRLREAA